MVGLRAAEHGIRLRRREDPVACAAAILTFLARHRVLRCRAPSVAVCRWRKAAQLLAL